MSQFDSRLTIRNSFARRSRDKLTLICLSHLGQGCRSTSLPITELATQKQDRSGLGLDAQRAAVRRFAEDECLTISAEHIEIETGKGADALELRQAELAKALKAARKDKCAVVWPSWIGLAR